MKYKICKICPSVSNTGMHLLYTVQSQQSSRNHLCLAAGCRAWGLWRRRRVKNVDENQSVFAVFDQAEIRVHKEFKRDTNETNRRCYFSLLLLWYTHRCFFCLLTGFCGLHSPVHNLMFMEELKSKNHTGCIKPEVKPKNALITCSKRNTKY